MYHWHQLAAQDTSLQEQGLVRVAAELPTIYRELMGELVTASCQPHDDKEFFERSDKEINDRSADLQSAE